jgi:hypothetical protein
MTTNDAAKRRSSSLTLSRLLSSLYRPGTRFHTKLPPRLPFFHHLALSSHFFTTTPSPPPFLTAQPLVSRFSLLSHLGYLFNPTQAPHDDERRCKASFVVFNPLSPPLLSLYRPGTRFHTKLSPRLPFSPLSQRLPFFTTLALSSHVFHHYALSSPVFHHLALSSPVSHHSAISTPVYSHSSML